MTLNLNVGAPTKNALRERFIVPPMSVLDARAGTWQDRKRQWIASGVREDFREAKCINLGTDGGDEKSNYTSIFDPVLTEILYRWFCPEGGRILDPFAGGVARGFVAGRLGYSYTGIDLSEGQLAHNRQKVREHLPEASVAYLHGDARDVLLSGEWLEAGSYDFAIACPPYLDLEVYSDHPRDLSNMSHSDFRVSYRSIIGALVRQLKPGAFAAFVTGPVRRKDGWYTDLAAMTSHAFEDAGMPLYNQMVLLTPIGSTSLRAEITYDKGDRKIARCHQDVLVFRKGHEK